MNRRRIRNIISALAVLGIVALAALGFTAATTTPAEAIMCWTDTGTCPWW